MSIDKVAGRNLSQVFTREAAPGFRFDSGPYIGVVKDNRDPTRSGRLQVFIAELGGDPEDVSNWRTVSYASPFFGMTTQEAPKAQQAVKNSFPTVRHTYGMWFNVPDLENKVLCSFVAGDPNRGYYFACIPDQLGHHMVPAIASSNLVAADQIQDSKIKSLYQSGKIGPELPVVEFNEYNKDVNWENFLKEKKPLHEPQVRILIEQGLDRPKYTTSRGSIFSSSHRETPAGVFGISTPGRNVKQSAPLTATREERKIRTRQGGHSFVMDDGDESSQKGKNNLTRWRSSGGHQILMDDSENIIYISNSNGSTWIEMTGTGHVNVYSSNSVNLRTAADLNLHVDKDVNFNVEGNFNLKVKKDLNIETNTTVARSLKETTVFGGDLKLGSDGRIDLQTSGGGSFTTGSALMITGQPVMINSGRGPNVTKPRDLALKTHADTKKDGQGQWQIEPNKIKTVSKIVPTHEPWQRKTGSNSSGSNDASSTTGSNQSIMGNDPPNTGAATTTDTGANPRSPVVDSTGQIAQSDSAGINQADQQSVSRTAPPNLMKSDGAPNFPNGLAGLTADQAKALAVQTAWSESSNNYNEVNDFGFLGKYQMGAAALVDTGHIKRSAYEQYGGAKGGNRALLDPNSWTGQGNVGSKEEFLQSPAAQEKAYETYTNRNANRLQAIGGIKAGDSAEVRAGMLSVAHLLGADGAGAWRQTGVGKDANNTIGATYFNRGRWAVSTLADGSNKG